MYVCMYGLYNHYMLEKFYCRRENDKLSNIAPLFQGTASEVYDSRKNNNNKK